MDAKEFFEKNRGKYFIYKGNKVMVVGVDVSKDRDYVIITYPKGWAVLDSFNTFSIDFFIDFSLCEKESKFYCVNSSNLTTIEQPELDLCKLLECCEGMTFYTTAYGYVKLSRVNKEYKSLVFQTSTGLGIIYNYDGQLSLSESECTLFPSKESRDWSTFKKPIKIKEGTHVMCSNGDGWFLREYAGGKEVALDEGKLVGATVTAKYIVPATEFDFTDFDSNKSKSII